MRLLAPNTVIAFAETLPSEHARAVSGALPLLPYGIEPDWFVREVAAGKVNSSTLTVNGERVIVIYWQVMSNSTLMGLLAVGLTTDKHFPDLMAGLEIIAKENGCKRVCFHTLRRGVLRQCAGFGYSPAGILFEKVL